MLGIAMKFDVERDDLELRARELRARLDPWFSPETAVPGTLWEGAPSSTGHCAAVALIVQASMGGELQSTTVNGVSHWFNRIEATAGRLDVDITGDQFGRPRVQIKEAGELYPQTRSRAAGDVAPETLERAMVLSERAGLMEIVPSLRQHPAHRAGTRRT
jgi:hypothetical protein